MKHVVISGYYGFNNTGDEAVLSAMLSAMREQASKKDKEIVFTVLSAQPDVTASRHHVCAVGRTDLLNIIRTLLKCDMFISGGGGLLQDTTGLRLSVAYYLGLVLLALLFGKPAVLYAHGIGPVTGPLNRLLVRLIANRATLITVRDTGSLEELARMGVSRPPVSLTADPAFLLTATAAEDVPFAACLSDKKPVIAVAVRAWKGQGRYLEEIAIAADTLAEELNACLVLIPMYYSEDLPVTQELQGMLHNDAVILEEENMTPAELLSIFGRLDLVLAVRLHALIFAAAAGVPMVGIGYDPKVNAFMSRLGLLPAGDTSEVTAPVIIRQALERWHQRDSVRQSLLQRRDGLRAEAEQAAAIVIETLFESGEKP
ncbi:MAG: polysaccharide pyruvyl transferase CsaB [Bacillota bacterium]|nr:polysaccharide pyruvyl transferase CsaB [Bacillota bacterium]MDW7684644.1 polysaccharide pyruvyl transferase CsaB [Bacillota bacterium]